MRVVTNDGLELTAKNAVELVTMLHSASYSQADSDQDWMRQTSERTEEQTGSTVRTTSAAFFVHDLIQLGLLKQLDEDGDKDDTDDDEEENDDGR
jgi:hypothetical protein